MIAMICVTDSIVLSKDEKRILKDKLDQELDNMQLYL